MLNTEGRLTSGEWCLKAERADHITIAWCEMGKVCARSKRNLQFGKIKIPKKLIMISQMDGPWSYDDSKQQIIHKRLGMTSMFFRKVIETKAKKKVTKQITTTLP